MDITHPPELMTFLIDRVLKNTSGDLKKEEREQLDLLTRDKVTTPVIYVGTG